MNISCGVISDLIPLVKDGVASEDSIKLVNGHIASCESCKEEWDIFARIPIEESNIKDEKIIFAIKRSILLTQLIILSGGAMLGVAVSNFLGMEYNFLLLPLIGGVSFVWFHKKWFITPLAIFFLTYVWGIIIDIAREGFRWGILYWELYYSTIYALFVCIGVIIAMLLTYAFRKER